MNPHVFGRNEKLATAGQEPGPLSLRSLLPFAMAKMEEPTNPSSASVEKQPTGVQPRVGETRPVLPDVRG